MDLSSDSESKSRTDLNELVNETKNQTYQDEIKKYTEILAYYANNHQQPGTSSLRGKRHTKTVPKIHKKTDNNKRGIDRNVVLIDENVDKNLREVVSNEKIRNKHFSQPIAKIEYYKKVGSKEVRSTNVNHRVVSNTTQDANINTTEDIEPKYADKMTYCRPVLTMYNQQFIYKTMERNLRLQRLVQQLVDARAREKHNEAWNNYINDLRNKHRYQSDVDKLHVNVPNDSNPEIIDYYNTKFTRKQSNPCQNLLQDIYSASNSNDRNDRYTPGFDLSNFKHYKFVNDSHCYPTSSQGRLMMINNQRRMCKQPARYYRGKNITLAERDYNPCKPQKRRSKRNFMNVFKNLSVQTESEYFDDTRLNEERDRGTFREKYNLIQSKVGNLKQKILQSEPEKCPLTNIEKKLDVLIESVNTFISEIRAKRIITSERSAGNSIHKSLTDQFTEIEKRSINYFKKDFMCGVVREKSLPSCGFLTKDSVDKIMYEEINKSDRVKRDIEELLSNPQKPCAVNITFDIPTKERSTEVTDSICTNQKKHLLVEEMCNSDVERMTIAVNTEPLGLLALIRVSADTVKQLLSYMPQIDYCSYLARLQLNHATDRPRLSNFECRICGATFDRPSLLSDHIKQQHNLTTSRDCCVCRHVIDSKQQRPGVFKCRHCGQVFTRAYCRELHEQECGRKLGISHDVSSSLMLLS